MPWDDGRLQITYNGEIYNFQELRDQLKTYGYRFRSNTDTEVILAAYDRWGVDCLQRFIRHVLLRNLGCEAKSIISGS